MRNKFGWTVAGILLLSAGCATVQVQAPKEPIKMDINMRLDVYQHVNEDIDAIENIVSGKSAKKDLASLIVPNAYASEGLSADAEEAAYRRRDRKADVDSLKSQGALSEGADALLALKDPSNSRASEVMAQENSDRLIIYRAIAAKNGSSVEDVQKIYAERLKD